MKNTHDIPVLILAGGLGTRLSEETHLKPKPMVEVGDTPILVHIMRTYFAQGFNDFVICAGYRSWEIKNYFLNYEFRMNHLVIDHRNTSNGAPHAIGQSTQQEKWRVRVLDTGTNCMTGARVARALDIILKTQEFSDFALTYGDGLCDADIKEEFRFHQTHGKIGTVLGVKNPQRYGVLDITENASVEGFLEKPAERQETINGGYFIFKKEFREFLSADSECVLERAPLETLAQRGELQVFRHSGFWHAMDTLRDKTHLESLWQLGDAAWTKTPQSHPTPPNPTDLHYNA